MSKFDIIMVIIGIIIINLLPYCSWYDKFWNFISDCMVNAALGRKNEK